MFRWVIIIAVATGTAIAVYVWLRSRYFEIRYKKLTNHVGNGNISANKCQSDKLLTAIYRLIDDSVVAGNTVIGYKTIDLLKEAFAGGLMRKDEPFELAGVIVGAFRRKQPDIAAATLDAFRQLVRYMPLENIYLATEQLSQLAVSCFKENYPFLAAKTAEVVVVAFERKTEERAAVIKALTNIGVLALKHKDNGLFWEIIVRLDGLVKGDSLNKSDLAQITNMTGVWLHNIVKYNNTAMFPVLTDFVVNVLNLEKLTQIELTTFVKDWYNVAGTACFTPNSDLAARIIAFTFKMTLSRWESRGMELTVKGACQVARIVILEKGIKEAFPYIWPLLDTGRNLLAQELKLVSAGAEGSYRRHALFAIVRELVVLMRFAARKDMLLTFGEVISQIYQCWLGSFSSGSAKSIKRFCQLLVAYWLRIRTGQEKKTMVSNEFIMKNDQDCQKLLVLI
ncbi:MAG: hypothetical protein H6Q74_1448 [Firmicutes bacterium]|nr:hypothetical protein [Bacillota bacterium]